MLPAVIPRHVVHIRSPFFLLHAESQTATRFEKNEWTGTSRRCAPADPEGSRGGRRVTVLDEAVTVVDDPKVQLRVRGLSVGQWGGDHSWMLGSGVSLSDGNEI